MRNLTKTLLLATLLVATAEADAAKPRSVAFDAAFGAPRISADADGLASARLDRTDAQAAPGAPALPRRSVRLALPPDADLGSVRVTVEPVGIETYAGPFDMAPAPPFRARDTGAAHWGPARDRIADGRDTAIYGRDALYPASWGEIVGKAREIRGFKSVAISLAPVRYRPLSGDLVAADRLRVTVSYAPVRGRAIPSRGCRVDDPLAARLLDNFAEAQGWYAERCAAYPPPGDDGIAVITTEEIAGASALLEEWIALRETQGYTVTVASDDATSMYNFDLPTGDATEDTRADRIRKWLKDNWVSLGLGWVFLIGNPDPAENVEYSIPMKPCAPFDWGDGWVETPPTDFYYANLTEDFDANGNGVCAEADDYVDFVPDVYVGRLPVYSDGAATVDEILDKILAYEEESVSGDLEWRRRVLLPDSIYWFKNQGHDTTARRWDGATIGEWLIREELRPRGMVWTSLYEREGLEASQFFSHLPIDSWHVVDQWVRGYGLVYWAGHGSTNGVYRAVWVDDYDDDDIPDESQDNYELSTPEFMLQSYTYMLEDAPPPFVIHDSCSNATPESPDSLAYGLLRRGAIATMAATRVAAAWNFPTEEPEVWTQSEELGGDSSDFGAEYAQNLIAGSEAGRALGDTIAVTEIAGYGLPSQYQQANMNLYGDPLVRLVMCREGAECDNGAYCDGQEWCDDGSCTAGEPVVCAPTDECAEMVCDDVADACVPAPGCIADAGPDAAPEQDAAPAQVSGYGGSSGCAAAPRAATRSLLSFIF